MQVYQWFFKSKFTWLLSVFEGHTRSAHDYKLNIHKFSFWMRYINKWNDLPNYLVCFVILQVNLRKVIYMMWCSKINTVFFIISMLEVKYFNDCIIYLYLTVFLIFLLHSVYTHVCCFTLFCFGGCHIQGSDPFLD